MVSLELKPIHLSIIVTYVAEQIRFVTETAVA